MKATQSVFLFLFLFNAFNLTAQVHNLNSYPSSNAVVYLDFDGMHVDGTSWNWDGPINAFPSQLSDTAIHEIFNRVSEDYRVFNLNITTDSNVYNAAPRFERVRILITPTSSWYGNAGGVSFVGSFTWGDDTPSWVFSDKLVYNTKYIAEACSHEAGHTFGLQHQSVYNSNCIKIAEYNPGQGTGEIGWAPIMGVGYYKNVTTWYNGTSAAGCNSSQSDIDIIAGSINKFGLRNDDYGNSIETATDANVPGSDFKITGIINNDSDVDVFRINVNSNSILHLSAIPQSVGTGDNGANLDIRISLLNDKADTIGQYNPLTLLNAAIDTNLATATYYMVVEGIGNVNLKKYGSVGYYAISGSFFNLLPLPDFKLSGSVRNNLHLLSWSCKTSEAIKYFEVQSSTNGRDFEKLDEVPAEKHEINYQAPSTLAIFYRIKAVVSGERTYYSNVIILQDYLGGAVHVINTLINDKIYINSKASFRYQLLLVSGQIAKQGKLAPGLNILDISNSTRGMLFLKIAGESESMTVKLIKQ